MKKYFLFWILLTIPMNALSYEVNLHKQIAKNAVIVSNVKQYLLNNLGIHLEEDKFKADLFSNMNAREWIEAGSDWEDDTIGASANLRFMNHFYDPTTGKGLNVDGTPVGDAVSSLIWGKSYANNLFNWTQTRNRYYAALTTTNSTDRNAALGFVFRSLGQLIHLVHDKAVPAHVRNDAHFPYLNTFLNQRDMYEKYTSLNADSLTYAGYNPVDVITFSSFDSFWANNGKGLAEFTNNNFVSRNTNIDDHKYALPVGIPEPGLYTETVNDPESGQINVVVKYLLGYVTDQYRSATSPAVRLSAYSYFDFDSEKLANEQVFSLNDHVHREYADFLLPRAVGYSAGLLNYFFRGSLDVVMPDRIVYGIADGSAATQQFTTIKAKVQNTTPNEAMGAGILQAVARYKIRPDYQPDLSTDPPTSSSGVPFSYSVSAPITITSLPAVTEFTFDFTQGPPIPAGITDLDLFVVFKGTLGNEADTAVAVGREDLYEPLHITVWNSTDRFYLDNILRTREDILNDPELLSRVDHNGDGSPDERINRYYVTTDLAFASGPVWAEPYQVSYYSMPPGRYGRLLLLADTEFWIHARRETSDVVAHSLYMVYDGVVNAEYDGTFYGEQVYEFRGVLQHGWLSYAEYYPDNTDIWLAPWPAAADPTPFPVGYIRQ